MAKQVVDDMARDVLRKICAEAMQLTLTNQRKTIAAREVQTAVRLVFRGELAKHAVSEGTKAVTKFQASRAGGGGGRRSTDSVRAGLQFPVGRVRTLMKKLCGGRRIGRGAPVYLAATLEYLTAELLELGGNAARDNKKMRITTRHVMLAARNDEELNRMFQGDFVAGGVIPNIHAVMLRKQTPATKSFGMKGGSGFGHAHNDNDGGDDEGDDDEGDDDGDDEEEEGSE